jgi:hypothetical protein
MNEQLDLGRGGGNGSQCRRHTLTQPSQSLDLAPRRHRQLNVVPLEKAGTIPSAY